MSCQGKGQSKSNAKYKKYCKHRVENTSGQKHQLSTIRYEMSDLPIGATDTKMSGHLNFRQKFGQNTHMFTWS